MLVLQIPQVKCGKNALRINSIWPPDNPRFQTKVGPGRFASSLFWKILFDYSSDMIVLQIPQVKCRKNALRNPRLIQYGRPTTLGSKLRWDLDASRRHFFGKFFLIIHRTCQFYRFHRLNVEKTLCELIQYGRPTTLRFQTTVGPGPWDLDASRRHFFGKFFLIIHRTCQFYRFHRLNVEKTLCELIQYGRPTTLRFQTTVGPGPFASSLFWKILFDYSSDMLVLQIPQVKCGKNALRINSIWPPDNPQVPN